MQWNNQLDGLLHSIREKNPKITWLDLAIAFAGKSGIGVTADQVRNRYSRIVQNLKNTEKFAATPAGEDYFEDTYIPEGDYVGFRIAFFDIETTDLNAMMGRILCWSIADNWGTITHKTIYDFPQASITDDRGVIQALRDELDKYDIIIGWNSKMFDISFLNARLVRWGKKPLLGKMHIDPMWRARAGSYGLRIGSSKLVNVSKFVDRGASVEKTDVDWDTWALAQSGDRKAMEYLVEHCDKDVLVTRSVFNHLKPMVRSISA